MCKRIIRKQILKLTPNKNINIAIVHCMNGEYVDNPELSIENPPVPAVPKESVKLSNGVNPPINNIENSNNVSPIYIP